MFTLLAVANLAALPTLAMAQSSAESGEFGPTYTRPTQPIKLRNYFFDTMGPYPVLGAAFAAGISQAANAPPEWKQRAASYGERFASSFAIAAASTTARYALAEALKRKTPCITDVSAKACFRGWDML
jgi:hypothetical protein